MEIREFYDENLADYQRMSSYLFHSPTTDEAIEKAAQGEEKEEDFIRIGAFSDRLLAAIEIYPYTVMFEDKPIKMGGIGRVVSAHEARGTGAVKKIFAEGFRLMREHGQFISHLFPFRGDYYRIYGYEVSAENVVWEIPCEYIKNDKIGTIKYFDGSEKMKADIVGIYHKFIRGRNLVLADKKWESFFEKRKPYTSRLFSYVHYTDGAADGFVSYKMQPYAEKTQDIVTENFWYAGRNGIAGLMGYFAGLKEYADKCIVCCNDDLSSFAEFNGGWGKKDTERKVHFGGSTRIVDVEKILKLKGFDGAFSLKITDEYCPWNNAVFTVKNGKVEKSDDGEYDAAMSIRAFSSLILGRYDNPLLVRETEFIKNYETLKRLFAKKIIFFDEHF